MTCEQGTLESSEVDRVEEGKFCLRAKFHKCGILCVRAAVDISGFDKVEEADKLTIFFADYKQVKNN